MTIKDFAAQHKVRIKLDEDGEAIVMAKHGQIYDYGSGRFGVMFLFSSAGKWNNRRKACEAAALASPAEAQRGMEVIQDGDTEGTLLFDPENRDQAKLAIRLVGAYRKRQLSLEQRQALIEAGESSRFRSETALEGSPTA
jgi:hypothetical protein